MFFYYLKCDLKCVSDTKGGNYYKDHLPLFGEKRSTHKNLNPESNSKLIQSNVTNLLAYTPTNQSSDLNLRCVSSESLNNNMKKDTKQTTARQPVHATIIQNNFSEESSCLSSNTSNNLLVGKDFKLGDRVNIDMGFELVQSLQIGHGGWCDAMFESLGNTGILTGVDSDNDFEVTYPSGNMWTFNPSILTRVVDNSASNCAVSLDSNSLSLATNMGALKVSDAEAVAAYSEENDFRVGDIVQICSDNEKMKLIQKGHGEWAEAMQPVC